MDFQNLRQMPIFASFSDDQLVALKSQAEEVRLQPGQVLFYEDDPAQGLFVIVEGGLEIIKRIGGRRSNAGEGSSRIDGHTMVVATVQAGSFVGEISLMTGLPHSAAARATTHTVCLQFGASLFQGLRDAPLIHLIIMTMVQRLRDTESQMQQHEKLSALGKMAAGLAHELNNPAAANLRAATQLPQTLATLQAQTLKLYSSSSQLGAEQLDFLSDLQNGMIIRAATATPLAPLAQSDLEERIMTWCDDASIDESWQIAPVLASANIDEDELNRIQEVVGSAAIGDTLSWLESTLTIAGLGYTLRQSASRISELVNAVKAYTYMDHSPEQEIDVHDGLDSTLAVLQHKLNGINVNRIYNHELPRITAFGSELNQVWTVLFDNAADALAGHGTLCVRTVLENDYLVIEVIDDGPGIPQDLQMRLFEPFFTTKPVGQGAGLGLSIARRIVVDRHHGMLHAQSRPGETRFQVYLPLN